MAFRAFPAYKAPMENRVRLGINIDHVATLRNARGGTHPDPLRAAQFAAAAGADGITAHLREDRRHITDEDIRVIRNKVALPLNFEMAATNEMQRIALEIKPPACCLVPEKREERTTEGGLDVAGSHRYLTGFISKLTEAGIRASLFIGPDIEQVQAAKRVGAPVIEIHTGRYAELDGDAREKELERIRAAARMAEELQLEVHAGHGLNFVNVQPIAAIPQVRELNIGHFLVGEAIFHGFGNVIATMRTLIDEARA